MNQERMMFLLDSIYRHLPETCEFRFPDETDFMQGISSLVSRSDSFDSNWISGLQAALLYVPVNAILRVMKTLLDAEEVFLSVLSPAGAYFGSTTGPIDAVVTSKAIDHFTLNGGAWRIQHVVIPHTRCWMIGCHFKLKNDVSVSEVRRSLELAPRVILAPEELGFCDSSSITEYFRDLGRYHGSFFESVVLGNSLQVEGNHVQMWVAAHDLCLVPETLDRIQEISPNLSGSNFFGNVDRRLGIISSFKGGGDSNE